jgi:hypothetical protein
MKKALLIFALSSAIIADAQCDKDVTYFSGKAEFLDSAGKVERSEQGKVVVKVSKTHILLTHNDDDNDTLNGEITDLACKWSKPFKKGKTTFNTRFVDHSGDTKNANVSIEGIEGKMVILINFKEWGKTLRLEPDSYDELINN